MADQLEKDNAMLAEMAKTGACDLSEWPGLCSRLIDRLEDIARLTFLEPPERAPTPPPSSPTPTATSTTTHPVSPPASSSPSPHPYQPRTPLAELQDTLRSTFSTAPPHTLQRLAELILFPTAHTTSFEKYTRALHRVLSVNSTVEAFPLPTHELEVTNGGIFSTEDSLGGARLTPIPWLAKSELTAGELDGPLGTTTEELANGVSQGELLRREQVLELVPKNTAEKSEEEGQGHEGPPELGAEDVGPQPEGTTFKPAGTPEPEVKKEDEEMKDAGAPVGDTKAADETKEAKEKDEKEKEEKKEEDVVMTKDE